MAKKPRKPPQYPKTFRAKMEKVKAAREERDVHHVETKDIKAAAERLARELKPIIFEMIPPDPPHGEVGLEFEERGPLGIMTYTMMMETRTGIRIHRTPAPWLSFPPASE